ncbi:MULTISPECIES: gliding motility lipoprotein GldD [Aequorivita]|uniref:Gliding motility lipoprotein GldD n=2 Tax=Aequorivita TaxID=153265 RepID=A0AB35YTB8_9FLAO|nr:gliding motility lipoprotein GldD [Aequorivita sp. Ant34-E75]WGF93300.1 gliding motility lipoprotein GldD [Aequorivita sp. Ant34-E75]
MKINNFYITLFISFFTLASCQDNTLVKPAAMLRLEYPQPQYRTVSTDCPYSFSVNHITTLVQKNNCGINITYPEMKATLYLTYQDVRKNNLDSLLQDAQKLAYDHTIKANSIPEQPYVNPDKNVYGMFYMINGNAATQAEFYVTDSTNHFLNGALYFDAKPNFDSIYPAVVYLREDIRKLMETITWQ